MLSQHWPCPYLIPILGCMFFSKSSSTTSLRTQCADAAVTHLKVLSPKVLHRRSRRSQKKKQKITKLLREVVVPSNQFKLSTQDIDSEIVVFDGGNISSPPIKPPGDILWRSISVNILYVEDEIDPNIGLTFPMMDGVNPFI